MTAAAPETAADLSGLLPESPFFEDGLADLESLHGRRDPAIGHHLENDFSDFFLRSHRRSGLPQYTYCISC
jgi:hypothetical protein